MAVPLLRKNLTYLRVGLAFVTVAELSAGLLRQHALRRFTPERLLNRSYVSWPSRIYVDFELPK